MKTKLNRVVVVMGSRSDLPIMKDASNLLSDFGIKVETQILSAHRTPELLEKSCDQWERNGVAVIIAGAGGAAHLPGMLASFSSRPVIGVPIQTSSMNGLDSLLSIAQMPKGVPVATVAVNNATNAGLLALQILAVNQENKRLLKEIKNYKNKMNRSVHKDRKHLKSIGISAFLKSSK